MSWRHFQQALSNLQPSVPLQEPSSKQTAISAASVMSFGLRVRCARPGPAAVRAAAGGVSEHQGLRMAPFSRPDPAKREVEKGGPKSLWTAMLQFSKAEFEARRSRR